MHSVKDYVPKGSLLLVVPLLLLASLNLIIFPAANLVFGFHENISGLDTEKQVKKYFKDHTKNDLDFKTNMTNIEGFARNNVSLRCGLTNGVSNLLSGLSAELGVQNEPIAEQEDLLQQCDVMIPYLTVYCEHHYDVFKFCKDTRDTFEEYIANRSLSGKLLEIRLSWKTYDHSAMTDLFNQYDDSIFQFQNLVSKSK